MVSFSRIAITAFSAFSSFNSSAWESILRCCARCSVTVRYEDVPRCLGTRWDRLGFDDPESDITSRIDSLKSLKYCRPRLDCLPEWVLDTELAEVLWDMGADESAIPMFMPLVAVVVMILVNGGGGDYDPC